jgi:hypothetical protein
MARQTSKGLCTFCHAELTKAGIARHLATCEQRATAETKVARKRPGGQKTSKLHLLVEGRELPMYWMHLEVTDSTSLATLDRFLRNTWLECCGHLSAFEIGDVRYSVDTGMDDEWGVVEKSMRVRLDSVLHPGESCLYEYDYGTTTELKLKVIEQREAETKGQAIQLLARNTPPPIMCNGCDTSATKVCSQCVYEGTGWLCDSCAQNHECGEDMLLPVVNSPRVGMCAYAG